MTLEEIRILRQLNQQLVNTKLQMPKDVVSWLGAVQAQEYAVSKWAIALRLPNATHTEIENAINKGEIIRTHILRPTWHFVAAKDIHWMLRVSAPRVHAVNAFMYRQCGLDKKAFARTNKILEKELKGGQFKTRDELNAVFARNKIEAKGHHLAYIMMYAELEGLICNGPRIGKNHTYALLEERVKPVKALSHEEALVELTKRYFASRGPATVKDYVWWSGLTVKDARQGIESLGKKIDSVLIEGQEYFFIKGDDNPVEITQPTFLMPDYDEYGIAYKDRSAIFNAKNIIPKTGVHNRMVVVGGTIAGSWKPVVKNKATEVDISLFRKLNRNEQKDLQNAIRRYKDFMNS